MAVVLWVILPLVVVHGVLLRWARRALRFQLLVDLVLLALFGPVLARGLDLNPVRCLTGNAPFAAWSWSGETALQPTQSDVVLQLHPWWEEARRQIVRGRVPWIAPRIGGGAPLLGNGQTGVLAPVMLPVWALGPERGTTVMAVWKVEAAALGTFLLLAVGWRIRLPAAALGAVLWGLGPFLIGWLLSPLAWSLAALPWVWWLVLVLLRGRLFWRRLVVGGVLLGWFMGAGVNPETAAIAVGSALLAGLVLHPRRWRRVLAAGALAALVTVSLAWPVLRTVAASSKARSYAAENPNIEPLPARVRVAAIEQMVLPMALGHPGRGTWRGPYPYAAGAIGIGGAGLIVLIAGGFRRRTRRLAWAATAPLALGAVLAFRIPPLDALLVRLPVIRFMTVPRFAMLVPWGLAILAALAADGHLAGRRRTPVAWIAAVLLVALTVLLAPPGWSAASWALGLSTALAAAAALIVLQKDPARLPWVAAVELVLIALGINPTAAPADRLPKPPILARLQVREAAQPGRIVGLDGVLRPNLASRYGLSDLRSFDPVRPWPLARLHALLGAADPVLPGPLHRAPPRLLGAWSVRYLLTPAGRRVDGWTVVDSGDGVCLWTNPFWLPEVRLVGRTVSMAGADAWLYLAQDPEILSEGAVIPAGDGAAAASRVEFDLETREADRISGRTGCDGPCLLVVAQPWAPGWRASVDGERAPVVRANLAGLGVLLPRGSHRFELAYRPYP